MKKRYIYLAELVSLFTNPVLLIVLAVFFVANRYASDQDEFLKWAIFGIFILLGPALLYASYIWIKDKKFDIDISNREDRLVPLLLATLGAVIGTFIISNRELGSELLVTSYVLVSMLVLLTLTTTVWKISLHSSTATAMVTLVILFGGWPYLWLLAVVFLVSWARLTLHEHTPAQVKAGILTGFLVTLIAWLSLSFR